MTDTYRETLVILMQQDTNSHLHHLLVVLDYVAVYKDDQVNFVKCLQWSSTV